MFKYIFEDVVRAPYHKATKRIVALFGTAPFIQRNFSYAALRLRNDIAGSDKN